MKSKTDMTITLEKHQTKFLEDIVKDYSLVDDSKAVRIIMNYIIEKAEHKTFKDDVFSEDNIRCTHFWDYCQDQNCHTHNLLLRKSKNKYLFEI